MSLLSLDMPGFIGLYERCPPLSRNSFIPECRSIICLRSAILKVRIRRLRNLLNLGSVRTTKPIRGSALRFEFQSRIERYVLRQNAVQ